MMLPNNVLCPVLAESRQTLNVATGEALRLADRNYKIIHQARFVSAPPTWRDYCG